MKLHVSDDLVLGADLVVSTAGIFATKGLGKSHLAQVMAEEMLAHGQVIVAIDPTDAWWGLRSSADGKNDGYPVVVIGGDHGDLKLEPGGAIQLAEAVVAERFSCVICTDGLSDMAETKFVREFLDTIYRKNRKPLHIFVDEADVFAPQKPFDPEDARCIRAMSHIVRRGRKKGIGTTLITQRPAELNASVRTMVDMLFVLGMSHNLDIDAVEKWLRLRKKKTGNNAAYALQEEMIASLDSLQRGDAWVWAPRMKIHKRFRAREKRTFDSGATPKPGQKVKAPKKLAPVDLQRLGDVMAAAVQRQKDNDPKELKRQITELRKELSHAGQKANGKPSDEVIQLRAENARLKEQLAAPSKSPFKKADLDRLDKIVARAEVVLERNAAAVAKYHEAHVLAMEKIAKTSLASVSATRAAIDDLRGVFVAVVGEQSGAPAVREQPRAKINGTSTKISTVTQIDGAATKIGGGLRRILVALAQRPQGLTNRQIGIRAGLSSRSGTFSTYLSRARAEGWIDDVGEIRRITDAGLAALGHYDPLPTGPELARHWLGELGNSGAARILRVLVEAYPEALDDATIGDRAGLSPKSGTYSTYCGKLRGLELIEGRGSKRASEELFA